MPAQVETADEILSVGRSRKYSAFKKLTYDVKEKRTGIQFFYLVLS
jgi:hypothetical protein